MSRHSRWAKIKRQKAATDARRGELFTKIARAITVAAREAGPNPETNYALRMEMDRALEANMPKENVARAIARATSAPEGNATASLLLEGYGPGGGALLIAAVTDNRNRTVAEIRKILGMHGGSLGESGSVAWQFERRGVLTVEHADNPDAVELTAIDAGALDVAREGSSLDILTPPDRIASVAESLRARGITLASTQLAYHPKQSLELPSTDLGVLMKLITELEEHPDVVAVTTNVAPPDI